MFDAAKNSGQTPQISINITSLTPPEIESGVVDIVDNEEE
jgi:hypothetical protein